MDSQVNPRTAEINARKAVNEMLNHSINASSNHAMISIAYTLISIKVILEDIRDIQAMKANL